MTLSLNDKLPSGKYAGLLVIDVLKFNPEYIAWVANHVPRFDLTPEARKIGQRYLNERRENRVSRQDAWAHGFGHGAKQSAEAQMIRDTRAEFDARSRAGGAVFGESR